MSLIVSALWFCFGLHAQDAPTQYAFEQLTQVQDGQIIQIRGFIYQTPEDKWIIAATPNLKSCCIGSESQANSQIHVSWENSPEVTHSAILAEGTFRINQGLKRTYYLENASIIEQSRPSWVLWSMLAIGLIGLAVSAKLWTKWT